MATGVNEFTVLMNWIRDGNLKSPFPKEIENTRISIPYLLYYFSPSPKYFIFINDVFNNFTALKLNSVDVLKTFKEIVYYTGYNSFQHKKVASKENELIDILWKKFPYFKRDDVCLMVELIDKSDQKDAIYEQFGLLNKAKVKKMTKAELNKRKSTIQNIVKSEDVLSIM